MDTPLHWSWEELDVAGPGDKLADAQAVAAEEQARLDAALAEAHERGRREGRSEGEARARRELASALAMVHRSVDQIRGMHAHWAENLEHTLAALAVGIARHLTERELQADPALLGDLVRSALRRFPEGHALRIRVHPRDLAAIHAAASDEAERKGSREARWVADEQIAPGSFLVEGPERVVDGRVDQALERVYWSLIDG